MKKIKLYLSVLLVVSMLCALATGCGSDQIEPKESSATTEQEVVKTDTEVNVDTKENSDEENIEITGEIKIVVEPQVANIYKQFIKRFEDKYPGVKVTALTSSQELLIASGEAPDLIKTGDLHLAASKDLFLDMNNLLERDKEEVQIDDFFPNSINPLIIDGSQMALPVSLNVGLLYYNKQMFDDANIAYPNPEWTNEDFINTAKALTKNENDVYTQWGSSTVLGWWGEWLIHVRQAGGDWMTNDQCSLDTPEAIAGLKLFYDKTTKGEYQCAPSPIDDNLGGFAGGKTAMEYGGHTGLWVSYNAAPELKWDIEVLPKGLSRKEGAEFAVEAYGISNETENVEAAWAFLKFLTGPDGSEMMTDMGRPGARKSVAEKLLAVPKEERNAPQNLEALYAAVDTGMSLPSDPNFIPCTQAVVQPLIDLMLEGKMTPEETAKEATLKANEYVDSN